jgi:hypothetical protein
MIMPCQIIYSIGSDGHVVSDKELVAANIAIAANLLVDGFDL